MKNIDTAQALFESYAIAKPLTITRIGGLTNRNYKIETQDRDYVLRIAGKGTDALINRSDEGLIVETIQSLNIDAPLIIFDEKTGVKICEFISGAKTLSADTLREKDNMMKVAGLLHTLHTQTPPIDVDFNVFDMVARYEKTLSDLKGYRPENFKAVHDQIQALHSQYHYSDSKQVLSHNDPLPENFILSGDGEMKLVDWEYGGMNSPFWDLADVSIEANFSPEEDKFFLENYLNNEVDEKSLIQFELNKLYIDLLWCLWGFIREQVKDEDDDYDFIDYGNQRFKRLEENLKHFEQEFIK